MILVKFLKIEFIDTANERFGALVMLRATWREPKLDCNVSVGLMSHLKRNSTTLNCCRLAGQQQVTVNNIDKEVLNVMQQIRSELKLVFCKKYFVRRIGMS